MSDLLAARSQMAMSLGFHIIFAVVGIGMPLLMVIAEALHIRTGRPVYMELARRWSKGTAIMFAVGAVSGTVLSFELGLLWPGFMEYAGPIIGMPFSMEGFAFFLEAIFLGIYLYGWKRIPPLAHLAAGVMVMISGTLSGIFVICANAWMNTPAGMTLDDAGAVIAIDPWAAMWNPASFSQTLHMTIASFMTIGFAVAGVHAWMLRREPGNTFHRAAIAIALPVGLIAGILQPISGDISAKHVSEYQPVKLAAMEGHWETEAGAPFTIGGWPDEEAEVTRYGIEIPKLLSFMAYGDPNAEVMGLKDVPREDRPPVAIVHLSFQLMVGIGILLLATGFLGAWLAWRGKTVPTQRWYLTWLALCSPLGFVAVEAGWMVTEIGRQPWVIHGIMRTKDAVTPMPGLTVPFLVFTALYAVLGVVVIVLMRRHVLASPVEPLEPPVGGPTDAS